MSAPYDGRLCTYIGRGLAADRPATPNIQTNLFCLWYATDTLETSLWNGTAWVENIALADAPSDGSKYVRKDGAWLVIDAVAPADLTTALADYVEKAGDTMTGALIVPDDDFDATWNGKNEVPTKNAIFDMVDVDDTLAANSDLKVASQQAVKAYIDTAVAGASSFAGAIDCSADPNYPAADAGDIYRVSVAGHIGGATGEKVAVNDLVICISTGVGGNQAGAGGNYFIVRRNMLRFAGTIACAGDPNYPVGDAGDIYFVSSAGHIGGASGKVVAIGDWIVSINYSTGGDEAAAGSQWIVLSFTTTLTLSDLPSITKNRVLGRKDASGNGVPQELTLTEMLDEVFPGTAAQGNILYRGSASWVFLPPNTAGKFLQTNGSGANPAWAYPTAAGGATARPWYWSPPLIAYWDGKLTGTGLQASAATDDSDVGFMWQFTPTAAGGSNHIYYKNLPSSGTNDWTLVAHIKPTLMSSTGFRWGGICMYESGTGKFVNFEIASNVSGHQIAKATGIDGTRSAIGTNTGWTPGDPYWLKITKSSTTYSMFYSGDGKMWSQVNAVIGRTLTTDFTARPDAVGLMMGNTSGTHNPGITCDYWALT